MNYNKNKLEKLIMVFYKKYVYLLVYAQNIYERFPRKLTLVASHVRNRKDEDKHRREILFVISFIYFWASPVAQLVKNLLAMWGTWVRSLRWEDPLEKGKATHSSIPAWRIPWTIQRVAKSQTRLSSFHFPMQGMLVRSLVRELSPHMPGGS